MKAKYNRPYDPEKEKAETSLKTAIRIKVAGESRPVEISTLLPRLRPLREEPGDRVRYYVPEELRTQALDLRTNWK